MMTTAPAAVTILNVRCIGWNRKRNRVCNVILARVEEDRWEMDMESEAELCCEACGQRYTLAEYKWRKL